MPGWERHRPLIPAVSIEGVAHSQKGTLCCFVKGIRDEKVYLLSCSHVINGSGSNGDPVIQPAESVSKDKVAELANAVISKKVDAAIATLLPDLKFENISPDFGPIKGISSAVKGWPVKIIGAYSGLVWGTVSSTEENGAQVEFPHGERRTFSSQLLIETKRSLINGDSGAPVLTEDNKLVGLFFASTDNSNKAMANKIDIVLESLGVELYI